MPITVQCPSCRAPLLLADNMAEEAVACDFCRHRFSSTAPATLEVLDAVPVRPADTVVPSIPPPAQGTPDDRSPWQPDHVPYTGSPIIKIPVRPRASRSPTTWLGLSALLLFGGGGCIILAYLDSSDRQRPVITRQPAGSPPPARVDWQAPFATISAEPDVTLQKVRDVESLTFSPDGKRFAFTAWSQMSLWNLMTARIELQWSDTRNMRSAVFRPNGLILASAGDPEKIQIWDAATGTNVATLTTDGGMPMSLAWHRSGNTLASAIGKDVVLWDVHNRLKGTVFAGHTDAVTSVAYSADGNWLASGSEDHTVILWNPDTDKPQFIMEAHTGAVRSVAFSPDGKLLASASADGTVNIWNTNTGGLEATLATESESVSSVVFHPKGTALIAGTNLGRIFMWEMPSGNRQAVFSAHAAAITCLAISRGGATLASGSCDDTIRLWRVRTRQ